MAPTINHKRGGGGYYAAPVPLSTLPGLVAGGNRTFADDHGEWADTSRIGTGGGPLTAAAASCRCSHASGLARPYWW
jgi:hypothetical protein